jgi:hypothetical protein
MVSMLATTVPSMPAIDISKLAALDERTAAPPRTPAAAAAFAPPPEAFAPPPAPASSASSAPGTHPHFLSQAFKPPPEAGELGEEELVVERSTRAIRLAKQFRNAEVPEPEARSGRSSRSSLGASSSPPAHESRSSLRTPSSPPARESRSSLRTPSSPPARASQSSLRAPASASGSSTRVGAPPVRGSLLVLALVAAVAIAIFATVVLRH